MFAVLIRVPEGEHWMLCPNAFANMINMIQKYQQRRLLFDEKTLLPKVETLRIVAIPISERTDHQKRDSIGRFERALHPVGYPCNTYLASLTPTNWVTQSKLYKADAHWGMPLIMRDVSLVHTEPIPRPRAGPSPALDPGIKRKNSRRLTPRQYQPGSPAGYKTSWQIHQPESERER